MRLAIILATGLLAVPMLASGQGGTLHPQCAAAVTQAHDACQKAADIFAYMAPQLGGALAANPVTPIGNFLPLTASVGAVQGYLPDFSSIMASPAGAQQSDFSVQQKPVPMPAITANLTLFRGIRTPMGRVGGLSAVGTLTLIPNISLADFSLAKSGNAFGGGYGAQLRAIEEGRFMPEISIAGVQRRTPSLRLTAVTTSGDSVRADSMEVKTRTIRLEASKHLGYLGAVVGVAQDEYDSKAVVSGSVATPLGIVESPVLSLKQEATRSNVYAGLTLGIFRATVGQISGGDFAPTYNTFTERSASLTGGGTPRPVGQDYKYGTFAITLNF